MGFSEFLKLSKDTRRIFGRKEIEIMIKQLQGVNLSQSERNRLSRDIRTKLKVIKDIIKFEDEFLLEKNQNNKRLIERAVDTILRDELHDKIKAILLFGSFADNSFNNSSDIDICVVFDEISLKEATKFRIRTSGELPEKVDIQVFNILPWKLKREIAKNHKVLYSNNYDNLGFTIKYFKDDDYLIRMNKIFGGVNI